MNREGILTVSAYVEMRQSFPAHAARCRDDLHNRAGRGSERAAAVLAELVEVHPWWSRTAIVPPATDAIQTAAARRPLFIEQENPDA
jgi:hypothetical protein